MNVDFLKQKYGYEIEGIWVPRVTAITSIVAKPALLRYYAEQENWAVAQKSLGNAANWGERTHEAVEKILKNETPEVDPAIRPSIEAFENWRLQHKVKILDPEKDIERLVFDEENLYAGRIDILGEIDGKLGILDLKTSTGIWEDYSLQVAAYLNAYNKGADRQADTRWILRIDQYQKCFTCQAKKREKEGVAKIRGGDRTCQHLWGKYKGYVEFKELENYQEDIKAFLSARALWGWYNRNWTSQIRNYPKNV